MANWWETQYYLMSDDLVAFVLDGHPIAIVFALAIVLLGYLTWICFRFVWEYYRSR